MKLLPTAKNLKLALFCTAAISASIVVPSTLSLVPGLNVATAHAEQEQKLSLIHI